MKKEDIIDAALTEFGENDYANASTNSIIEKSNTSKGTFYHYFNNKENLYLELAKKVGEKKIEYLETKLQSKEKTAANSSVFEMLLEQITLSMDFALEFPRYAAFGARISKETNIEVKEKLKSVAGNIAESYFKQMLNESMESGVIREDLPKEFVFSMFVFMLTHFADFMLGMGVEVDVSNRNEIVENLEYYVDFLQNGLGGKNKKQK